MNTSWRIELPQIGLILLMVLLAVVTWPDAPDRIPVQWNLQGQVTRYAGRAEGLLLLPALALAVYLFLLILPRIDPARANYAWFATAYTIIRVTLLSLLALAYGVVHVWIRGTTVNMGAITLLLIGAACVVLGSVLGQVRPNWFVGVRTPWTLSSQESWTKTHRLGGWLFIVLGLWALGLAVVRTSWAVRTWWVAAGAVVVILVVYSYLVWRDDPHRTTLAGESPASGTRR